VAERLREQPLGDRLDPGDEGRLLRPEEERLDELAIVGLLGRIGLDRQLPHTSQMLLRRDRHAIRGVGTERVPVLGGLAHVLVPEDHGDRFAIGREAEHALSAAGLTEGIGNVTHGFCRAIGMPHVLEHGREPTILLHDLPWKNARLEDVRRRWWIGFRRLARGGRRMPGDRCRRLRSRLFA
jgi:hypothetical protein